MGDTANKCTDVKILYQTGSERDVYATWKFNDSLLKHLQEFQYVWQYRTANSQKDKGGREWFDDGGLQTKAYDGKIVTRFDVTYSPPENAKSVRFAIRPIAKKDKKTEKVTNKKTGKTENVEKEVPRFTSAWCNYVTFELLKMEVPVKKASNVSTKQVVTQDNLLVRGSWSKGSDISERELGGWSYSFRKHINGAYEAGETDVEVAASVTHADFPVEPNVKKVKFSVKPIPIAQYFVGYADKWVEEIITAEDRAPYKIEIAPVIKTDRTYEACWYFDGSTIGITGFDYEWQYYRKDGTWMPVQTGSITADSYEMITKGFKRKSAPTVYKNVKVWHTNFDVDATATKVRVRVKAQSNLDKTSYTEVWSAWFDAQTIPPSRVAEVPTIIKVANTKNTIEAKWGIQDKSDVASFSYEWQYRVLAKGEWFSGSSGSVDFSSYSVTRPDGVHEKKIWITTYSTPEGATDVRFRVKPIATYSNSFISEYPQWTTFSVTPPTVKVTGITINVADAATGMLRGDWTALSGYTVDSYECVWKYTLKSNENLWLDGKTETVSSSATRSLYSIPNDNVAKVEFRVRPKPKYDQDFIGAYGDWVTKSIKSLIGTRTIQNVSLSFRFNTDATIDAFWEIDDRTNVDSFECEWRYRTRYNGTLYPLHTTTVDASTPQSTDPYRWLTDYDYPDNAYEITFRVRAVPASQLAFICDWSSSVRFNWSAEIAKIPRAIDESTFKIEPYNNLVNREIYGKWKINNKTYLGGYECQWRYLVNDRWMYAAIRNEPISETVIGEEWHKTDLWTFPEEASKAALSIRPVPTHATCFDGKWTTYIEYEINKVEAKVDNTKFELDQVSQDSKRLILTWSACGLTPDSWEISWQYQQNDYWLPAAGDVHTLSGEAVSLLDDYDGTPDDATATRVRVRPVYDNDPTKDVQWSNNTTIYWGKITAQIDEVTLSIQRGTTRTVVATWDDGDMPSGLDSFSYEWRYTVDGVFFTGSSGSTPGNTPACTYDAPENADTVAFRVMPVPITPVYFTGEWTVETGITIPADTKPETPASPTARIDGFTLRASVDTYDVKTSYIDFEVIDEYGYFHKTVRADVNYNRASFALPVQVGSGYRVRARGVNDEGYEGDWCEYTPSGDPGYLYTIPTAVTGITVEGTSEKSVSLVWAQPAGRPNTYTVEYTTKTQYFDAAPDQVKNVTVSVERAEILNLESDETGEWYFRIKATNDSGDSEWSSIVSIVLGTVPDAPTTWSSTISATVDREVYLFWVHNSQDSSKERFAELELNVNGTTTVQTITKDPSEGTTSAYLIEPNTYTAGARIRWRVRTKGALDEYGEWSISRQVDIYAPPTLALNFISGISAVSGSLTGLPITFQTNVAPITQTPIGYSVSIISNNSYDGNDNTGAIKRVGVGEVVYSDYFISNSHTETISLGPGDVNLATNISYTLRVVVSMDSGLSAEDENTFIVAWEDTERYLDAAVSLDAEYMGVSIIPYCTDANGVLASDVTLAVYRRDFDGGFTLIGDNIPNDRVTTIIDPHPALDYGRYRIVSRSETTGEIDYYDLPLIPVGVTSVVLQWDEIWSSYDSSNNDPFVETPYSGSILTLPYNVDVSDSNTIDSELIEYIGRRHPVSYYGTQVGQKLTLRTDIAATDTETIYALRRLAVWMGDVYVREPNGSGYWAKTEVSFSKTHLETVIPVTINVTRVEGGV